MPGRTVWAIRRRFRPFTSVRYLWEFIPDTRDFRIHDPMKAQILVTVPEILSIMLLSVSTQLGNFRRNCLIQESTSHLWQKSGFLDSSTSFWMRYIVSTRRLFTLCTLMIRSLLSDWSNGGRPSVGAHYTTVELSDPWPLSKHRGTRSL